MDFQSRENGILQLDDAEVPYQICRSARRRRTISLSFGFEHGLRLMVPLRTSSWRIKSVLTERAPWIRQRLRHLNHHGALHPADEFRHGADILYLGQKYRLQIACQKIRKAHCQLDPATLEVTVKTEQAARKAILNWYRERGEELLKERLQPLAAKLGVRYRHLLITNARRLWGSCSPQNDIRINWRILMTPLPLIDYLLAHELCHIVHRNHSKRFWGLLERLMPDHRTRKKQLRELEADLLRRGR